MTAISSPLPLLQKDFVVRESVVNASVVGDLILQSNSQRFGFIIVAFGAPFPYISTNASPIAQQGLVVNNAPPYCYINFRDHGPLACKEWYHNSTAVTSYTVFEIIYQPK